MMAQEWVKFPNFQVGPSSTNPISYTTSTADNCGSLQDYPVRPFIIAL